MNKITQQHREAEIPPGHKRITHHNPPVPGALVWFRSETQWVRTAWRETLNPELMVYVLDQGVDLNSSSTHFPSPTETMTEELEDELKEATQALAKIGGRVVNFVWAEESPKIYKAFASLQHQLGAANQRVGELEADVKRLEQWLENSQNQVKEVSDPKFAEELVQANIGRQVEATKVALKAIRERDALQSKLSTLTKSHDEAVAKLKELGWKHSQ